MPERIALIDVVGYGRAEVNGRLGECVVGEEVLSKAVEGCRLEGVLSSIFRLFAPPPVTSSGCGNARSMKRISVTLKSVDVLLYNCAVGIWRRVEWVNGRAEGSMGVGQLRCQIGSL